MGVEMKQYDVYLGNLDPTVGSEYQKTLPCLIISPDVINRFLNTIIVAPMTTNVHPYPTRVKLRFRGKNVSIALDQIRTIDRQRLVKALGTIPPTAIREVKRIIKEMLVD
jgi:mRNA interferase MazF